MEEKNIVQITGKNISYTVPRGDSKTDILRGADFSAKSGEFVGIVGPNGAGKTTLLKALAGFIAADGEILYHQKDSTQAFRTLSSRDRARMICYMHQDTTVPFSFTVREVVSMGRHPWQGRFSSPGSDGEEKMSAAMKQSGCFELADRSVQNLSGGERQRVMLARALAQDTPVLLLDEPTSSLDIGHAQHVFRLCRELTEEGRCVVAVLHDLRQAAAACSRLYLMHEGGIVAEGTPDEVLTAENIEKAYGVHAQIFRNPAGQWDFYVSE